MILRAMRFFGALAILTTGAVHLQQFGLFAPIKRISPARRADAAIATLAPTAVAIGSLVALFISESGSLFGFIESGYRAPIVVAIAAEAATIALLAPVATVSLARAVSRRREAATPDRGSPGSRLNYSAARWG